MDSTFYASVFGVFSSPRDCKIVFQDVIPEIQENGEVINRPSEKTTIVMSMVTAKELVNYLSSHITEYEKQFGEIVDLIKMAENEKKPE